MTTARQRSLAEVGAEANRYGCPAAVYAAIIRMATPLLRAVAILGPSRAQWIGSPGNGSKIAFDATPTCWALDGTRATEGQLKRAAGLLP